jgi:hypothetical protein
MLTVIAILLLWLVVVLREFNQNFSKWANEDTKYKAFELRNKRNA